MDSGKEEVTSADLEESALDWGHEGLLDLHVSVCGWRGAFQVGDIMTELARQSDTGRDSVRGEAGLLA